MEKSRALHATKDFLSDTYEKDICEEIIRNSVLDLRKLQHKFQNFRKSRTSRKIISTDLKRRERYEPHYEADTFSGHFTTKQVNAALKRRSFQGIFDQGTSTFKRNKISVNFERTNELYSVDYAVGSIVWSRLLFCESWPAIIISAELCGQKKTSSDKCWVFWFGDHKVSEVSKSRTYDFRRNFKQCYNTKNSKKTYVNGILEALRECWIRLNKSNEMLDSTSLLQWSFNEFLEEQNLDQLSLGVDISDWIILILKKYSDEMNKCENLNIIRKDVFSNKAFSVGCKDACISCKSCIGPFEHPFFYGQLCLLCKERLSCSLFKFDEDGFNAHCIICAQSGELFLCDHYGCNKVYCSTCLIFFIGELGLKKIRHKVTWTCFLCSIDGIDMALKARTNWRECLEIMFQPEPVLLPVRKCCLRVLSLFDGVTTGKLVLDDLKIRTEVYYASEIDSDSLLVSKMRHSGGIVQWIGDVTSISFEKLHEISPIDLLIGGSPCNDFSVANPSRKGFDEDGTGVLFYEFYRILASLREIQTPGRPLFWLFENVASMQKLCKSTISRFFNCYPALLDAKYFSAQRRPRLFWGNIPGMYCPPQYGRTLSVTKLKDNLFPGRRSQVDKIKTVTTKINSLIQNNKNEMPVVMNNNEETLFWVPELESSF